MQNALAGLFGAERVKIEPWAGAWQFWNSRMTAIRGAGPLAFGTLPAQYRGVAFRTGGLRTGEQYAYAGRR